MASVPILLNSCRPVTVIRRIWAIVVYSLQHFARGSFAHVCHEVLKTIRRVPTNANGNSTSTIVLESCIRRVFAPSEHGLPNAVLLGMRFAVRLVELTRHFWLKASTRPRVSVYHHAYSSDYGAAALAVPNAAAIGRSAWSNVFGCFFAPFQPSITSAFEGESFGHDVCLSQLTLCKWQAHRLQPSVCCDLTI